MRWTLDRIYERLLFTYPSEYRAARGGELVATAMEKAHSGQRLPSPREVVGFIVGGLRTRARLASAESRTLTWADGLRLGAAIVMALAFSGQINNLLFTPTLQTHLLPMVMIAVIVALLRAPRRIWVVLAAAGLVLAWGHVTDLWLVATNPRSPALFVMTPVDLVANVLPWVVPFVLASAAFLWRPQGTRGPTVWPWWFVGLLTFVPSLQILKGVSTDLFSVPAVAVAISLAVLLWPLIVVGVAFVTREARLSVAVVAWACASLIMNGVDLVPGPRPAIAWLLNPGVFAVVFLGCALAITAVINRRLARV